MDVGYGKPPLMARPLNLMGGSAAPDAVGATGGLAGVTKLDRSVALPPDEDVRGESGQLARPQTADSNFSSLELSSNAGDDRPGFERCGGRATKEQQGVPPPTEAAQWDLDVAGAAIPVVEVVEVVPAQSPAQNNGGGGKWWKPSLPFRGNRGAAALSSPSAVALGKDADSVDSVVTETIGKEAMAAYDRSNVRTPDSSDDRSFHGPNRRAPRRNHGFGRPPIPARSSPADEVMPGLIADPDSASFPRLHSGGSAAGRSPIVPARQSSPGSQFGRQAAPNRIKSMVSSASDVALGGVSAWGGGMSVASPQSHRNAPVEDTAVCAFRG